ncbi:phage holin [Planomicrobium sp. YIM 101495]|uniref:phage holin n=1 Tax=Planomicrobium sp. YIM 101495 TaxID=2665160 RepID=UPI0012B70A61|nr:phage holin [Planomicrobium sp. YIM 101495]MTD30143.1 phage holin [Planomicrobium sp. YIM 101495]
MKVNWKVRLQHGPFLVGLFSLVFLFVQQILGMFGYGISDAFTEQAEALFNTVLSILVFLGLVSDPITEGLSDSRRGLDYKKPAPNVKKNDKLY